MRATLKIVALLAGLLLSVAARADNCSVTSASIAFGAYDSSLNLTVAGSATISCNQNESVVMQLSAGTPGGFSGRVMTGTPSGTMKYNLYVDSTYSTVWGDGTSGTGTLPITVAKQTSGTFTFYGKILLGQASPVASYSQSLVLSIVYSNNTRTVGTLTVTASVPGSCTISSVGTMNFGNLGLTFMTTDLTGVSANINYTCSGGMPATITLGQGTNPAPGSSDTAPLRRMRLGATTNYISYSLYSDSARTRAWGNTAATGLIITGTGAGQTSVVYGTATHATVPVGSYSDTVVVTISF